jgi:hypothetical protein
MYYSVALLGFAQMVVFSDIKKTEIMENPFTPNSLKFVNNLLILCYLLPKPSKTPRTRVCTPKHRIPKITLLRNFTQTGPPRFKSYFFQRFFQSGPIFWT